MNSTPWQTRIPGQNLAAIATIVVGFGLASARPARAEVNLGPWGGNAAHVHVESRAGNTTDGDNKDAPGAGSWSGTASCDAYDSENQTDAAAVMSLHTEFNPYRFYVTSSGVSALDPGGSSAAGAIVLVWFTVDFTQELGNTTSISGGTLPTNHSLVALVNSESPDLPVVNLVTGTRARVAPGQYLFWYYNSFTTTTASGTSNTLTAQLDFTGVPLPVITVQPQGKTVSAGSNVSFSVGTSGTATTSASTSSALIYQWRYRYQNMTDGGRISGAHTNQLQIANVAVADTGIYDCVVTQGSIEEPSSVARLRVTGTTGVGDWPAQRGLSLSSPMPNPFGSRTLVAFTLPVAAGVSLDVLDVSGRRVRSLLGGEWRSAGAQAVEWNGRSDRGDRVPAGLYFVRLVTGADQRVQRAVRVNP